MRNRLRRESKADGDDTKVMRRLVAMLGHRRYGHSPAFDVVSITLAAERERRRV